VKLEAIEQTKEGIVLVVSGIDLRDNTPIYDIKPYLPYVDSHPDARGGFAAAAAEYELKVVFPQNLLEQLPLEKRDAVIEVLNDEYVLFSILSGLAYVDMEETDESVLIAAYEESSRVAANVAAAVVSGEFVVEPWTEIDLIRNAIAKAYGPAYTPSAKVHADTEYLNMYMADTLKLDAAWVKDIIIEIPMISAHVDMLILVNPTEGNAENVLNTLKAYKTYLVEESRQYPMNEARVKSAVIEQVGDYVCFSILGGVVEDPESFPTDEELENHYADQNMYAIYALQGYLGIFE